MNLRLRHGDCIEVLKGMKEGSVGAVVSDPPYGLKFMGKAFDNLGEGAAQREWHRGWVEQVYRVLLPGGVLKAFSGTRTVHHLGYALQEAGFVDVSFEAWNYGSGFPKSHDVSKGIDKAAGAEREAVGVRQLTGYGRANVVHGQQTRNTTEFVQTSDVPASDAAKRWEGWGTALKPSWEPVVVGRKP